MARTSGLVLVQQISQTKLINEAMFHTNGWKKKNSKTFSCLPRPLSQICAQVLNVAYLEIVGQRNQKIAFGIANVSLKE